MAASMAIALGCRGGGVCLAGSGSPGRCGEAEPGGGQLFDDVFKQNIPGAFTSALRVRFNAQTLDQVTH